MCNMIGFCMHIYCTRTHKTERAGRSRASSHDSMVHIGSRSSSCSGSGPSRPSQRNPSHCPVYIQYRRHQPTLPCFSDQTTVSICSSSHSSVNCTTDSGSCCCMTEFWKVLTRLKRHRNTVCCYKSHCHSSVYHCSNRNFYSSMIPTSYLMSPSTSYRHQTSSSFPLTRLDHLRGLRRRGGSQQRGMLLELATASFTGFFSLKFGSMGTSRE